MLASYVINNLRNGIQHSNLAGRVERKRNGMYQIGSDKFLSEQIRPKKTSNFYLSQRSGSQHDCQLFRHNSCIKHFHLVLCYDRPVPAKP